MPRKYVLSACKYFGTLSKFSIDKLVQSFFDINTLEIAKEMS